jgi:hypothetical protein
LKYSNHSIQDKFDFHNHFNSMSMDNKNEKQEISDYQDRNDLHI